MITLTISDKKLAKLSSEERFRVWHLLIKSCEDIQQIIALNQAIGSICFPPDKINWLEKKHED